MKENTKLLLLLIFILVLLIIMIIPIQQNREFKQDAVIYKQEIQKISSRLDKIDGTINDIFNNGFNCNLIEDAKN